MKERKTCKAHSDSDQVTRFNGAAPVKERKTTESRSRLHPSPFPLQWGRSGEGAEDPVPKPLLAQNGDMLQWGRSGEGAEDVTVDNLAEEAIFASMGPLR